jgi:hypothetical protein
MAGPTRTKTQREIDYAKTAEMDRMGCTQEEIAAEIGVSAMQISLDLRKLRKRHADLAMEHTKAVIGESLAALRDYRWEAWKAWERSKAIGKPNAEFLNVGISTVREMLKLFGMGKADININAQVLGLITAGDMVTFANLLMAKMEARIADPELVQAIKDDVLAELPNVEARAELHEASPGEEAAAREASPTEEPAAPVFDIFAVIDITDDAVVTTNNRSSEKTEREAREALPLTIAAVPAVEPFPFDIEGVDGTRTLTRIDCIAHVNGTVQIPDSKDQLPYDGVANGSTANGTPPPLRDTSPAAYEEI